ncbi:triose-phosphate isomerase [candidate division WOR-3 bacterium]|nr:triose-phosphate isomerase [candidate division WOR-3 bacterium]
MTRRILIAGNWKMNLIDDIQPIIDNNANRKLEILVCPPFTHLGIVKSEVKDSAVKLGAQNVHDEDKGAFTGEISYSFLKSLGIEYVIIGHSERRHVFNETDEFINKKIRKGLKQGFQTILCVGETETERNANRYKAVIENQLKIGLMGIENNFENIIIAYEPVWAIGTGKTATPFDAEDMHRFIREKIAEIAGNEVASDIRILYGGSVKEDNVKELLRQDNIDGALIGGASLKYEHFNKIIEIAELINI